MVMSKYQPIYRCRLCGGEFKHCDWSEEYLMSHPKAAFEHDGRSILRCHYQYSHWWHKCKDGSLGIADFIGFRKEADLLGFRKKSD